MIGAALVWSGLALATLGLLTLVRPLGFLGIRSRRRAAVLLGSGALLVLGGWSLPAPEVRVEVPRHRIDEFVPVYQFSEHHATHVEAGPKQVYAAIRAVTADEIPLFRTLTGIRRLGRPGPESILDAPERTPLLDVATGTSFLLLAEDVGREIVIGTLVLAPPGFRARRCPTPDDYRRLSGPGFVKPVMNFRVEPEGHGGCRVSTQTRVFATDPASRRSFARYWRVILMLEKEQAS